MKETIKDLQKKMTDQKKDSRMPPSSQRRGRNKDEEKPRLLVPDSYEGREVHQTDVDHGNVPPFIIAIKHQIMPETDITDWPEERDAFVKKMSELPKLTKAIFELNSN